MPLRRKFGLSIHAWTVPNASPERTALEPDPAQHIAGMEKRWLEPLVLPGEG